MRQILGRTDIRFTRRFGWTSQASVALVVLCLYGLFARMDYGVDFRGGAEIQFKAAGPVALDEIRAAMEDAGYRGAVVQAFGDLSENEFIVKVSGTEETLNAVTDEAGRALLAAFGDRGAEIRKVDIVGPKAGAALRVSGFQAMLWALIAIMIYIGLRFDFKYSPGAIAALFHDVAIIMGIFAFSGMEFTLQTVAAILAVIGYSVNDTVIVYDRVREHEQRNPERGLAEHIDNAVNETLSRTVLTSGTTLFVSCTMYWWGGESIRNFFMAISLGVLVGTYSSIFVAAPVTLLFDRLRSRRAAGPATGARA